MENNAREGELTKQWALIGIRGVDWHIFYINSQEPCVLWFSSEATASPNTSLSSLSQVLLSLIW